TAIGIQLIWDEKPNKKSSSITACKHGTNPKNKDAWGEQHRFLLDVLVKFRTEFGERIKGLDASDWQIEAIPAAQP
ncbi:MAG: DUF4268 domain-containing protein, partial [Kiritimatiellia bacterium]